MQTQEAGTRPPPPPLPYPLDENKIRQILVELDEGQQTCVRSVLQCWQHGRLDEDDLLMQMKTLSSKSPTLSALFRKSDIQDARTTEVATADEMQEDKENGKMKKPFPLQLRTLLGSMDMFLRAYHCLYFANYIAAWKQGLGVSPSKDTRICLVQADL